MEIRKVNVEQLNPAAYNPRKKMEPGSQQYERLSRSLDEFGYVDPIIWNETTGNVVGGHQRLSILVAQGATELEVSVVNLDEIQERTLNIALNKISGTWENQKLVEDLNELLLADVDLLLTGYDQHEIDLLTIPNDAFVCAEDIDLSTAYKEPQKKQLRCPKCSHVDSADRFTKL